MRVEREDDDCIAQQGILFIGGRTPPRAGSTKGAAARGGSTRRLGLRLLKP
jgi:hypothetical protein